MEYNRPMEQKKFAIEIIKKLTKAGYTAYFAGGWVRDYVMDHPSSDIDIATDAPPDVILDLFPRTILVGLAFGVVIVVHEGHQFEVSTFRKDLRYEGGRRPAEIEFSDAREDALRRDFTINGMFFDPIEEKIIDYVGGIDDIKKGLIRTIGDADERFIEDRLRMIRAVRFAARFNFNIDLRTQEAIKENADTLFPPVAMERVWQEFVKMSAYPRFDHALIELHRLGLLPIIFPALASTHLHEIKQLVSPFSHFPKDFPTILALMTLFPNASLEEQMDLCSYLHTSNHDMQLVDYFYRLRQQIKADKDLQSWAHLLAHPKADDCIALIAAGLSEQEHQKFISNIDSKKTVLNRHIARIVTKKPLVNAQVLMYEGIKPGKGMGHLIKEAEKIAICHDLHETSTVLELLKKSPVWQESIKESQS